MSCLREAVRTARREEGKGAEPPPPRASLQVPRGGEPTPDRDSYLRRAEWISKKYSGWCLKFSMFERVG